MDGTDHFCESCGCSCDCGRDTDIEPCDYCAACYLNDYKPEDDWDEEYE